MKEEVTLEGRKGVKEGGRKNGRDGKSGSEGRREGIKEVVILQERKEGREKVKGGE